jgi:hypothetical protein
MAPTSTQPSTTEINLSSAALTDYTSFTKIAPPQQLESNVNEHVDFGAKLTADYINRLDHGCTNRVSYDANGLLTKTRTVLSTYPTQMVMTSISNVMAPTQSKSTMTSRFR